jgi:hypothetical protein
MMADNSTEAFIVKFGKCDETAESMKIILYPPYIREREELYRLYSQDKVRQEERTFRSDERVLMRGSLVDNSKSCTGEETS